MSAALYDDVDGFYQAGGSAGRRGGDFVTSPEVGSLYGAVWAAALDRWWEEMGRPDPYFVVEAAAGTGVLAREILAAGPACAPALRYVLVEQSATLRQLQGQRLALELPALVLGPAGPGGEDDDGLQSLPGNGPLVTALAELPAIAVTGVVMANELLDNLPVDLLEWRDDRWFEVRVAAADEHGDRLVEVLVPAPPELVAAAERLVSRGAQGARIPLQRAAADWLRRALSTVEAGRVVVVDYADTTTELAAQPWSRWLRTFRQHQLGSFPLDAAGIQDITCVVATDQLATVRPPNADRTQSEWLAQHGLGRLVDDARATWHQRAAIGDLAALAARSRVHEAETLTDPSGLGGFRVLEWVVGVGVG